MYVLAMLGGLKAPTRPGVCVPAVCMHAGWTTCRCVCWCVCAGVCVLVCMCGCVCAGVYVCWCVSAGVYVRVCVQGLTMVSTAATGVCLRMWIMDRTSGS